MMESCENRYMPKLQDNFDVAHKEENGSLPGKEHCVKFWAILGRTRAADAVCRLFVRSRGLGEFLRVGRMLGLTPKRPPSDMLWAIFRSRWIALKFVLLSGDPARSVE